MACLPPSFPTLFDSRAPSPKTAYFDNSSNAASKPLDAHYFQDMIWRP